MKNRQEKITQENRKVRHIRRTPFIFAGELLLLALLLVTASYAPQMIFQIQDSFLCDMTTLGQRENMDVESLSITYEKSLAQRMRVFAEGLMTDEHYYLTSQNLTVTQEIYDYLNSEKVLYQDIMLIFSEIGFVSPSLFDSYYDNYYSSYIEQWKQYVIYSDNYAEGVNFILWYIELTNEYGAVLKMLVDAETGTLYAFKTENIDHYNVRMSSGIWEAGTIDKWWSFLANYYESVINFEIVDGYLVSVQNEYFWTSGNESTLFIADNGGVRREGNVIDFFLPYGESSLELRILLEPESLWDEDVIYLYYQYPNMTFGFRQIYEMIPEFA